MTTSDKQPTPRKYLIDLPDDPLTPSLPLLSKLGSIIVHLDEFLSAKSHPLDRIALEPLLRDEEVRTWIKAMGVYLPVKR